MAELTRFSRLERMAGNALDRIYDEPFDLLPMVTSPNGRRAIDTDRPRVSARGVFSDRPVDAPLQLGDRRAGGSNDFRVIATGRSLEMSVSRRWYSNGDGSADAAKAPRQGDRIRLSDRPEQPEFEIVSAEPDGQSRIILKLAKAGARNAAV